MHGSSFATNINIFTFQLVGAFGHEEKTLSDWSVFLSKGIKNSPCSVRTPVIVKIFFLILPSRSLFKSMDDNFIIVVYVWLFICLWIGLVVCVFTINSYSKIRNENYRESKSWTSSFAVKRTLVFSFLDFVAKSRNFCIS